jgi:uncharacterized membrane protein (UPF0127 family)
MAAFPLTRRTMTLFTSLALAASVVILSSGCDEKPDDKHAAIKLGGKTFVLELALDTEHRFKGLSGRTEIKPEGGMLFVFPDSDVTVQKFVMRDCPIPIDIVYLDKGGRITAFHKMTIEPPRKDDEKENVLPHGAPPGTPDWARMNAKYEARLKPYSSKHDSQFVIELKGNTLDTLKLKEGDKVELASGEAWTELKKRAK